MMKTLFPNYSPAHSLNTELWLLPLVIGVNFFLDEKQVAYCNEHPLYWGLVALIGILLILPMVGLYPRLRKAMQPVQRLYFCDSDAPSSDREIVRDYLARRRTFFRQWRVLLYGVIAVLVTIHHYAGPESTGGVLTHWPDLAQLAGKFGLLGGFFGLLEAFRWWTTHRMHRLLNKSL